jgi:5-(carboxyamino)imidazole ribonucleotide synthase
MLPIGSTIGILGGGQLGRMLSVAAAQLGFKCHVYEPEKNPPAGETSAILTTALYTDYTALEKFAKSVDVVTFEFENIPSKTLDYIESIVEIFPDRKALKISQDRLFEKNFLTKLGLETAPYLKVDNVYEFKDAVKKIGTPAILKTRTMGYDGKGQVKITNEHQVKQISKTFKTSNHILEGLVDFTKEISVISVRNSKGEISCFDPGENIHENGVLKTTTIPAQVPRVIITDAILLASKILTALDYIGVLGVELFISNGKLIVNEIAPRVHNSGHWTQNGCVIDQFEQHIRAISGWPLGDGVRYMDVTMENLLGNDILNTEIISQDARAAIHLYGKKETRPGRKMGHVNRLFTKN